MPCDDQPTGLHAGRHFRRLPIQVLGGASNASLLCHLSLPLTAAAGVGRFPCQDNPGISRTTFLFDAWRQHETDEHLVGDEPEYSGQDEPPPRKTPGLLALTVLSFKRALLQHSRTKRNLAIDQVLVRRRCTVHGHLPSRLRCVTIPCVTRRVACRCSSPLSSFRRCIGAMCCTRRHSLSKYVDYARAKRSPGLSTRRDASVLAPVPVPAPVPACRCSKAALLRWRTNAKSARQS